MNRFCFRLAFASVVTVSLAVSGPLCAVTPMLNNFTMASNDSARGQEKNVVTDTVGTEGDDPPSAVLTVHVSLVDPEQHTIPSGGSVELVGTAECSVPPGEWIFGGWECEGGSFSPSSDWGGPDSSVIWTAPTNCTGSATDYRIKLSAVCIEHTPEVEGYDYVTITVESSLHEIVASMGYGGSLYAEPRDTCGHCLHSWHWDDNGAGGHFCPSPDVHNPTYIYPQPSTQAVEIRLTVTAICGVRGTPLTWETTWLQPARPSHYISASASASPSTIPSGGTVELFSGASDSAGHVIVPGARWMTNYGVPLSGLSCEYNSEGDIEHVWWTAPGNNSGAPVWHVLVAEMLGWDPEGPPTFCGAGHGYTCVTELPDSTSPHAVTVSASANPTKVQSGGTVQLNATATDSLGHGIDFRWTDNGAKGSFSNEYAEDPTWQAPTNTTDKPISCSLTVRATCDNCSTEVYSVLVQVLPNKLTVTQTAEGPFLRYIPFTNTFTATLADGSMAFAVFRLNGVAYIVFPGPNGVSISFDMGSALISGKCMKNNTLVVTAFNNRGKRLGNRVYITLQCVDAAPWMIGRTLATIAAGSDNVEYSLEYCYPDVDIDATVMIPGWVPLIGGKTGAQIKKACAEVKVSDGKITGSFSGGSGLYFLGRSGEWSVEGSAGFCICPVKLAEAQINLSGTLDIPWFERKNFPIPGITVSVIGKFGLSAVAGVEEGDGSCGLSAPAGSWHFKTGELTFTPGVEATLKAGNDWVASVTGSVGLFFTLTGQLPGNPADCCLGFQYFKEFKGTLYASVKGCFLGLSREEKFSWDFANCPEEEDEPGGGGWAAQSSPAMTHSFESGWSPDSRHYLISSNGYMLNEKAARPAATMAEPLGEVGVEARVMQNIYPHAFPRLATNSAEATLVYAYDVGTPGGADLEIGAMQYNGATWDNLPQVTSVPYPTWQPDTVYDNSGKPICIWVGLPTATGQETDPSQLFPKMEIFASRYDGSVWSAAQQMTSNSYLDGLPRVIRGADGVVTALWISQSASQFPTMPDDAIALSCDVWAADWSGEAFGSPYMLATGLPIATTPNALRLSDGRILATFARDGDGMSNTDSDREIALLNWSAGSGTVTMLTSDAVCDEYPRVSRLSDGSVALVWAKKGFPKAGGQPGEATDELWSQRVWPSTGTAAKACDTSSITDLQCSTDSVGNMISLWTAGSPEGSDIYYAAYESSADKWSLPQQISADLAPEKMLTAGLTGAGVICAYLKTQASVQDVPQEMPDGSTEIMHGVVLGDSDLYVLTHAPSSDLEVGNSDLQIDPAPSPGASVTLYADAHCWGDVQQTAKVTFYDGDPANGGAAIASDNKTVPAGGKATFSVPWTVPSSNALRAIYAKVDPDDVVTEGNEGNNTGHIWILRPDISVGAPRLVSIAGTQVVMKSVLTNILQSTAPSILWEIRLNNSQGTLLGSGIADSLAGGTSAVISATFDTAALIGQSATIYVVADPQQTIGDANLSNNTATGALDLLPDIVVSQDSATVIGESAALTLTNEGVRETGSFICRATGDNVTLGEIGVESVQPGSSVDINIPLTSGTFYTELFLTANPDGVVTETRSDNNFAYIASSNYTSILSTRKLADGTRVTLPAKLISASFGDCFYIQEADKTAGLKVEYDTMPSADQEVTVSGELGTQGVERLLFADSVTTGSAVQVMPLFMATRSLGGSVGSPPWLGFADSVGMAGAYNLGLLTSISGAVTFVDHEGQFAYIDDGSVLNDGNTLGTAGTAILGLRIILPIGVSTPSPGNYVGVSGIASSDNLDGFPIRALRVRYQNDIVPLAGSTLGP